jgi:DNA-binding response OmpR family regulator
MPKILLVGEDLRLLGTRAAVLGKTGAEVACCSGLEARNILERECFDLVVFCHTLTDRKSAELTGIIQRRWPDTRILTVVSDVAQERLYRGVEFEATSSSDPSRLIRRVWELLQGLPNHRIEEIRNEDILVKQRQVPLESGNKKWVGKARVTACADALLRSHGLSGKR